MIKDRITQELKFRMLQEIYKTRKDNKEHGFLICTDNKGNLSASKSCKGRRCDIEFPEELIDKCPYKIQGNFHTHPLMKDAINRRKRWHFDQTPPKETMKKIIIETERRKGHTLTDPSLGDKLTALLLKHNRLGEKGALGTVCIATDINEKVECWTAKDNIKKEDVDKAYKEFYGDITRMSPNKWLKPLFDKEFISLK